MEKILKFLKVLAAGAAAFAILCGLTAFYYLEPMHQKSTLGNTDFNWPAGSRWLQMVEGISWGRFDDRGFNNRAVIENPDILLLGSSHMESIYVQQSELLSAQLEDLLGDGTTVYNMGISGGHLPKSLQYLPKTLESFEKTPGLILIEAHTLQMTEQEVASILEGTIPSIYAPKPQWMTPILSLPYMRLLAQQKNLGLLKLLVPPRKPAPAEPFTLPGEPLPADDPAGAIYDPLFLRLQDLEETYGTELLIFYQPTEELQRDGSVLYPQDPFVNIFASKCREYGIDFLNITDQYLELYEKDHALPHGFITGRIGTGHLNAQGHRAIAEAIHGWLLSEKEGN